MIAGFIWRFQSCQFTPAANARRRAAKPGRLPAQVSGCHGEDKWRQRFKNQAKYW